MASPRPGGPRYAGRRGRWRLDSEGGRVPDGPGVGRLTRCGPLLNLKRHPPSPRRAASSDGAQLVNSLGDDGLPVQFLALDQAVAHLEDAPAVPGNVRIVADHHNGHAALLVERLQDMHDL